MYTVRYGGKRGAAFQLVESPNLVVVRMRDNQGLESVQMGSESQSVLNTAPEVLAFPAVRVSVRQVAQPGTDVAAAMLQRDAARAILKQEPNVRFAGRVLQDAQSGALQLYTENFFVKFKDKIREQACLDCLQAYGLHLKRKLNFAVNAYFVAAPDGTGLQVFDIAEKLLQEKSVQLCHPELIQKRKNKIINPLQWHLAPTQIGNEPVNAHVNIQEAWRITRGQGVTIAVIDDGLDMDHPEFAGKIVFPYNVSENNDNPRHQYDEEKHGTSCAGMATALGLPDGASGTAPEAQLMPIRLDVGLGSVFEANAFVWAADHGADVISCSWGPDDGDWSVPSDPMHKRISPLPDHTRIAIDYALNEGRGGKGCVVLFAAGNGNEPVDNDGYASYPGVIAVAACNDTAKRSVYSDYGNAIWACFPSNDFGFTPFNHPKPLSTGLRTTDRLGPEGYNPGSYTNTFGGTSGACPGLAGIVGLMLSVNPGLRGSAVKDLIRMACVKIDLENGNYDTHGHSPWYGYGRIDAGRAVQQALPPQTAELPGLEGAIRFAVLGEQAFGQGLVGGFQPARRLLGMRLQLTGATEGLELKYRIWVAGVGVFENTEAGAYVGLAHGRQRIVGFSVRLEGGQSAHFDVVYAGKFAGLPNLRLGQNGDLCGWTSAAGKTLEGLSIQINKKAQ